MIERKVLKGRNDTFTLVRAILLGKKLFSYIIFHQTIFSGILTLKAQIKTAANNFLIFFFFKFSKKIGIDISCESSAKQTIHMTCQESTCISYKVDIALQSILNVH